RAGGEVLHRRDPRNRRDLDVRSEIADGGGDVGEGRVDVRVAEGRKGGGASSTRYRGDPLPGVIPLSGASGAAPHREEQPLDPVLGNVKRHDGLGTSVGAARAFG